MERFIEKLKTNQAVGMTEQNQSTESEKIRAVNPCVVCCITMGKEPHAGHMFQLAIAEQIRTATDSKLPIVVINNNTGPRAAGAVIKMSEMTGASVEEIVDKMDRGIFNTGEVMAAYRSRKDEDERVELVMNILSRSANDIFSVIAKETSVALSESGFVTEVLSESALNKIAVERVLANNSVWSGSGFVPYLDNKRVVVLQKSGSLTASGSLLTSFRAISEISSADLLLMVDGTPDIGSVTYVLTKTTKSVGAQVPGSGISFNGKVARGTTGEALSIKDISKRFASLRPNGNLKKATVFLTLTRPISYLTSQLNLAELVYDFKDNESLIDMLVKCEDERIEFVEMINSNLKNLRFKLGENTICDDKKLAKQIGFLGNRMKALIQTDLQSVIAESKRIDEVKDKDSLDRFIVEMGYGKSEEIYSTKTKTLGMRRNLFYNHLLGLVKLASSLKEVSQSDLDIIIQSTKICLERLGI